VVQDDRKVTQVPVKVPYIEETFAAVEGIKPGARVVIEGAQNLRPGSVVAEAERQAPDTAKTKGESKKGKKSS
jgi:multidrug efflux pump subunit AcrA (membrane-fusion protein)